MNNCIFIKLNLTNFLSEPDLVYLVKLNTDVSLRIKDREERAVTRETTPIQASAPTQTDAAVTGAPADVLGEGGVQDTNLKCLGKQLKIS